MLANRLILTTALLLVASVGCGIALGVDPTTSLTHIYTHSALLGWVALGMVGLIYAVNPRLQRGWLPEVHYWLHTLGLVVVIAGFAWTQMNGGFDVLPMALGGSLVALSMLAFGWHVLRHRPAD